MSEDRVREKDRSRGRDRSRDRIRSRDRSHDRDRSRDRNRSRERDRSRDRDLDRSRDRYRSSYRDRSRERSRYDDYRWDDRYHSDRYRDDRYSSRYDRDRGRDRDYSRRDRSRSKSRDDRRRRKKRSRSNSRFRNESLSRSRSRSNSKSRSRSKSRTSDKSNASNELQRPKRDLSVEIEQELQNLRKLSDMKATIAKLKEEADSKANCSDSSDSEKAENSNPGATSSSFKKEVPFASKSNFGKSSKQEFVPEIQTEEERIEFQKKMQEKLQAHLAAEGKLYPKPKPSQTAYSATGFANDGSFLEMFKQMQQHMVVDTAFAGPSTAMPVVPSYQTVTSVVPATQRTAPKQPVPVSIVGRRRGGKILKTGIVKKQKPVEESNQDTPNDAWNLYLAEVRKYKNASCDADSKTRPLVK
ncbi:pre-mRNA-splicing factor 38B-like [Uranotaenia lowii]|uniref:pre-mRNA-splicing factor 38B-like n=1 Tax=Uranotaenia lowii TaxID=190385 RepID=UPI00247ABD06|nr:pre-mRNA-splicing factor 38B-like [Uranotaenia lowii]XP_055610527.1 pre-mRNA-splicing factor 38B-like [Uranotaenia lowii]XP_055610528.1 pre-mRNA-splicing factor 38B-like [Uranotaenia lowii]XP_055610529.1 pre-mRNA-splicing factor 38B-like [Uranotaenia lowii]